jgi:MYXO-CTERM domain-containing protein
VGCLANADCGGTTPVCSGTTNTCIGCLADGAPSCPDPAHPACQKTGLLAGACTECSSASAALCGGSQPQCLAATGLCGCAGAAGDPACGAVDSGLVCSGPNGFCVAGCGPGRNGCPTGQACVGVVLGLGHCEAPAACTADADCATPTGHCDTMEGFTRCVQCLVDTDCPAPFVCAGDSKTCVECTPTNQGACRIDLGGARCVGGDSCGCATDADCGGVTSGRVCDATTERCVPGCRQTGGNGCPPSLVCASTGAVIGTCGPAGDGGVDAGSDAAVDAASDADAQPDAADASAQTDVGADATGDTGSADVIADGTSDGANLPDAALDGGDAAGGMGGAGGAGGAAGGVAINNPGGYLAGGGCHCDAAGGSGSGGALLLLVLTTIVVRRRRKSR